MPHPASLLIVLLLSLMAAAHGDEKESSPKQAEPVEASESSKTAQPDADSAKNKKPEEADKDSESKQAEKESAEKDPVEGHSFHGEVFNEGPRQAAYLMEGVGNVNFDVTAANGEAKAFFQQGVAQLHGFWYFESERSFRQCAVLDPDCAMAYWGMAMSNRSNADRAKGFIKEAVERKKKSSSREQKYIDAFDDFINAKSGTSEEKKKRSEKYLSSLDSILIDHPDDIECKAFICEFFWSARRDGISIQYSVVDAMIQDILDKEPLHPAHHYRIHLWDTKKADKALESAARCGMSAPSIAHMWHMPGHIYSRLKRYQDAVYQQEASARVDHAHMMKDLILPDQIHNFAHNNEWCIRNLVHIGRVNDAIDLSCNMIEMPRHPKYNNISKFGSNKYGRQRLLDVLRTYQLHEQIVAFANTPYLQKTDNETEDLKTNRYVASAYAMVGQADKAVAIRDLIQADLAKVKAEQTKAGDEAEAKAREDKKDDKEAKKARSDAEKKLGSRIREFEKAIQEIDGRLAVKQGKLKEALELFKKSGSVPIEEQVVWMLDSGEKDEAVKKITDHVRTNKNEVRPMAAKVEILHAAGKTEDAKKALQELQKLSATIDVDVPAFARLTPIAKELGMKENWVQQQELAADLGARPPLDALGPFRWQPVTAADWALNDTDNKVRSLADFKGQPVVVIFYLGAGCLHCAEQLQKFAPKASKFKDAGYELIAISSDQQEVLHMAYKDLDNKFEFPLVADPELDVFKAYRCYDDFEKQALHGTFLIDADGKIRWQDISYEPFMDPDFVLEEAKRLLGQDSWKSKTQNPQLTNR